MKFAVVFEFETRAKLFRVVMLGGLEKELTVPLVRSPRAKFDEKGTFRKIVEHGRKEIRVDDVHLDGERSILSRQSHGVDSLPSVGRRVGVREVERFYDAISDDLRRTNVDRRV